jgi:hypothetical protein
MPISTISTQYENSTTATEATSSGHVRPAFGTNPDTITEHRCNGEIVRQQQKVHWQQEALQWQEALWPIYHNQEEAGRASSGRLLQRYVITVACWYYTECAVL